MAQRESLLLNGWVGGLNAEAHASQLENTEVAEMLNVEIGLRGSLRKRRGFTKHSTDDATFDRGTHLYRFTPANGNPRYVIIASNGVIGTVLAGTLTEATPVFTSTGGSTWRTYPIAAAALNDRLYLTCLRGTDAPKEVTSGGVADVTSTVFDGTANRFPRALALATIHDRIFAGHVQSGSAGAYFRSRVHYSALADSDKWNALDYFDVNPDDGQEITALQAVGEQLFVFKERSIHVLSGKTPLDFQLFPLEQNIGCIAPQTIKTNGGLLYWFDQRSGVWAFNGSELKRISDKIQSRLLEGINSSVGYKSAAICWRNRYYLSVPWNSDTVNSRTFIFDEATSAWSEHTLNFQSAIYEDDQKWFTAGPKDEEGVWRMDNGLTDDGADIPAFFKTGWFLPTGQADRYRLHRIDAQLTSAGNYNVTFNSYRNFGTDPYRSNIINTSPEEASLWGTFVWGTDEWGGGRSGMLARMSGWGDRYRNLQIEVTDDSGDQDFEVNSLELQVSRLTRRHGDV